MPYHTISHSNIPVPLLERPFVQRFIVSVYCSTSMDELVLLSSISAVVKVSSQLHLKLSTFNQAQISTPSDYATFLFTFLLGSQWLIGYPMTVRIQLRVGYDVLYPVIRLLTYTSDAVTKE